MRSARDDDLTGRAAIRNAALRLFAESGPDAVTIRQIAAAAGVSPALVLHHFASKAGLRAAVDQYVAGRLEGLLAGDGGEQAAEVMATGSAASIAEIFAQVFPPEEPIGGYVRRLLLSGDPAGVELVATWFDVSRQMLDQMVAAGLARESGDPDVRAAFLLVADLGLILLRDQLGSALGFDPMSPAGLTRWAAEVAAITRDGVLLAAVATDDHPEDD